MKRCLRHACGGAAVVPTARTGRAIRTPSRGIALLATMMALAVAPASLAADNAVLIDHELNTISVNLTAVRDGQVSYFDHARRQRLAPVRQFVQLRTLVAPDTDTDEPRAAIELIDGQRLVGKWIGVSEDGDTIIWESDVVGRVTISLDELSTWTVSGKPLEPYGDGEDAVRLTNGDEFHGFVAGIDPDGLRLEPTNSDQPIVLPVERIDAVRLANQTALPRTGQNIVNLHDGTRVIATGIEIDQEALRFHSPLSPHNAEPIDLPLDRLARIDFESGGYRLLGLVDSPRKVTAGGAVFGVPTPPRVEAGALLLHAPVTIAFEMPEHAVRVAAVAELAENRVDAADLYDWADFELTLRSGEQDQRVRLNAENPRHRVNIPLDGGALDIEMDPGVNGPVLDRLRLRDAVILVKFDADTELSPSSAP